MQLEEEKALARSLAKCRLAIFTEEDFTRMGRQMADFLFAMPLWQQAACVFCYVGGAKPVGGVGEVDTSPILEAALAQGKKLAVPKTMGSGLMKAIAIDSLDALQAGSYGILEPKRGSSLSPADIDLAILPCLAAGPGGKRLGRGGGYYDRFLALYKNTSIVLCPKELISSSIPQNELDRNASLVLTEEGLCPDFLFDF